MGRSIFAENQHQALDRVIWLTNKTTRRKDRFSKSCRTSFLIIDPNIKQLESDARKIQSAIKYAYFDSEEFQDPAIESCKLCYADVDCFAEHQEWETSTPISETEYSSYQADYQQEFCRQMAIYAQENAHVSPTLHPTHNPPSSLMISISRYKPIDFEYRYDFAQCQSKQLVCPEINDSKSFIHPSCLTKSREHSIQEIQEKIEWMDDFSNKILSACPNFPLHQKQIDSLDDRASLYTCFDDEFRKDPNNPDLINLNLSEIMASQTQENLRKISLPDGTQFEVPMTHFNQQRIKLTQDYKQLRRSLENPDRELSSKEKAEIELKIQQVSKRLQEIVQAEIDSLPSQQSSSSSKSRYQEGLETILKTFKFNYRWGDQEYEYRQRGTIPDYHNQRGVVTETITTGGSIEEFPADLETLSSLQNFIEMKVSKMITRKGKVTSSNNSAIAAVSKTWAYDCINAYFNSLGCNDKYPHSPDCSSCSEELSRDEWGEQDSLAIVAKSVHRKLFYKGRKCVDYKQLIQSISLPTEIKKIACSERLKLPSRNFVKTRARSCQ